MGAKPSPLDADFKAMLEVRRAGSISELFSAIGWTVLERDGAQIVYKSGGTGGYASWLGFDLVTHRGAVVLANADSDVSDIGWRMLDPHYPLRALHRQIAVSAEVLDGVAGRYKTPKGEIITVARQDDHLVWSVDGGSVAAAFPASKRLFFTRAFAANLAFDFTSEAQTVPARLVLFRGRGAEVCERL